MATKQGSSPSLRNANHSSPSCPILFRGQAQYYTFNGDIGDNPPERGLREPEPERVAIGISHQIEASMIVGEEARKNMA